MYGIFEVDLRQQSEKCLVGVVSDSDGGCCSECGKPLAARVSGVCIGCAFGKGGDKKKPGIKVSIFGIRNE